MVTDNSQHGGEVHICASDPALLSKVCMKNATIYLKTY